LRIIEQRAEKINTLTLKAGMWLRVREDAELVKRMCIGADKSVIGYPVGWEPGMEKTCGKCYRVTVVSREYRQTPVIGLSVADGLVAISRGATSTYGWYFPVEALEVREDFDLNTLPHNLLTMRSFTRACTHTAHMSTGLI
jgi:hypothetical protein